MSSIHATAVAIGATGVLLRGPSGSGKSSLALRLIDQPGYGLGGKSLRATLIADDQVIVEKLKDQIILSAPYALRNKIEIRGLGIRQVNATTTARLALVVDLMPFADITRMPEREELQCEILGVTLPRLAVDGTDPAAPAVIRASLFHAVAKAAGGA